MSSWRECKLGDVAEITSSKRIFYSEYVPSGIPFWRSKEVIEKFNRKNISTDLFISNEKYHEIKSKFGVPQQNDILLTSVGTLGIPYLVQSDEQFYFKDGNLTWIKNINNELLNPLFLFKWLASSIGRESLHEITIGSTQEALTISGLKTLELLLPPLEEQKAIAEVLSSLDDKIDLLHRQNQTLESLAQTLFRQWFIEEAKEEWKVGKLGDILLTIESGIRPKGGIDPELKNGFASIGAESINGIGNFNFKNTKYITEEFFSSLKRGIVDTYDVLIYKDGAYIGKKAMFGNGFPFEKFAINEHVFILRSNEKANQFFLYFLLEQDELATLNANSAQPGLNQEAMKSFQILIPPYELIEKFGIIVKDIVDKILFNSKQIQSLENLRDTLLPKLLSGEVRVKI